MPVCCICKVDKPETAFYRRKSGTIIGTCKVCKSDQQMCRRLGITLQDLLALEVRSGGKCECCGRPSTASSHFTRLSVDHCHTTGAVRGLLCHLCNTAIGLMEDDPVRLRQAANYLESRSPSRSSNEGVK